MSSIARPPTASRRTTWTIIGTVAVTLAALTSVVALGWRPLVAADVRIVLLAHSAIAAHPGAVAATIAITDGGSPAAVDVLTAVAAVVLLLRHQLRAAL